MDPVHERGSMDPVHESSPWTRSKVGVMDPWFMFCPHPFEAFEVWWNCPLLTLIATLVHVNLIRLFTASYKIIKFIKHLPQW